MSQNNVSHKVNRWLSENYGSRRGAFLTYWYRTLCLFGRYRKYRQIDWGSINRLVFVCKGNICRSAYSEAFAKSLGIEAISCGIATDHGNPANDVAIKVGSARGFDLSQHETTSINSLRLKETDLILAMEPWQVEYLSNKHSARHNCSLLGLWGKPKKPYIHDPYGASLIYFNNCFNYLEDSIHEVARKIGKN